MHSLLSENVIEDFIQLALEESCKIHQPTSNDILGIIAAELRRQTDYIRTLAVVHTLDEMKAVFVEDRKVLIDAYKSHSTGIQQAWDHVFGSLENDRLFYLSLTKFNDKLIDLFPREQVNPSATDKPDLTHHQIAILCHLTGRHVKRVNAESIALEYGQTSGPALERAYNDLMSPLTRTAKGKFTIKNYEAVIPRLSGQALEKGLKEFEDARKNNQK